ncbi:hypothetical protein [Agrobacterium tumefaciens]|uniref:hypothetical protein n=1 Tax=Agrobacterium tumefaciens TaxID=358 RepID=UPI003457F170
MTDEELIEAKKKRPSMISCCPERKMVSASPPQPVAWQFRCEIFPEWQTTDQKPGDQAQMEYETGVNMRGLEVRNLYTATPAQMQNVVDGWKPISQADKSIAYFHDILGDKELRIGNSYPIWVRDAEGRIFEALWSDNGRQAYWWDIEGESPVNPVEFMPHPLSISTGQRPQPSELDGLELHLKSLVIANPEKALLAAIDDYSRTWFVAELISVASGHVPLTEIEAMVLRHLAPTKGGEA